MYGIPENGQRIIINKNRGKKVQSKIKMRWLDWLQLISKLNFNSGWLLLEVGASGIPTSKGNI
ncbi:hypothetical protein K439DRAFT_991426 [Ramaria rubella]|nr:hypothetical protein K439DRAFT_991426 [Ramaria rubella]